MTRAPYACDPAKSRGRLVPEAESAMRTAFQRDRDRVIHSTAFRRLKHKTQVFVHQVGDHYRTRLTHSIEVAQIARTLARALALDEDLAEALALAHDLGHTPFGHTGEDALDAVMREHGGFDHNAQTLRILTRLEQRYAAFDGLNLTWETLEGVVKHNGPLLGPNARPRPIPGAILEYNARHDLALDTFASLEAQVASIADDIAYNTHDLDDGLRARLFTIDDVTTVPLAGPVFAEVRARHPGLAEGRLIGEAIRALINLIVTAVLEETRARLLAAAPRDTDAIRALGRPSAGLPAALIGGFAALRNFLFERMYRHPRVTEKRAAAARMVQELFRHYFAQPALLPAEWSARAGGADAGKRARVVADYIAGMTDSFAQDEHQRIFGTS